MNCDLVKERSNTSLANTLTFFINKFGNAMKLPYLFTYELSNSLDVLLLGGF